MVLLERLPEAPLRVGLGLVSLGFVAASQRVVSIPGFGRLRDGCFVETPAAMAGVGGVSGVLFGATNVGVQLVAYVKSCDLPHGLFVGVVAMVFLGLNGVRVAAAGALGLYPDLAFVAGSIGAVVPAVLGVRVGVRFRDRIREALRRGVVLWLLAVIGVRLVFDGFAAI